MDHGYFLDRVSAYHDRDLPLQELALMEEHLRDCAECRALLKRFEQLDALVERKIDLAGGDYWEQAAKKIEQRIATANATTVTDIRPRRSLRLPWKFVAAAASVVLLGYLGLHKDDIFGPANLNQATTPPTPAPVVVEKEIPANTPPSNTFLKETDREDAAARTTPDKRAEKKLADALRNQAVGKQQAESVVKADKPVQQSPPIAIADEEVRVADTTHVVDQLTMPAPGTEEAIPKDSQVFAKAARALAPQTSAAAGDAAGSAAQPTVDLASLRHERDSLIALLANLDRAKGKLQLPTALDQGLVSREKKAVPRRQDVERQLLETSYQLLINSPDSAECRIARALMERVAEDSASANRDLATHYLRLAPVR
jgi:hypothetical protein